MRKFECVRSMDPTLLCFGDSESQTAKSLHCSYNAEAPKNPPHPPVPQEPERYPGNRKYNEVDWIVVGAPPSHCGCPECRQQYRSPFQYTFAVHVYHL